MKEVAAKRVRKKDRAEKTNFSKKQTKKNKETIYLIHRRDLPTEEKTTGNREGGKNARMKTGASLRKENKELIGGRKPVI